MRPGIYADILEEDYHRSPGLSQSMLKLLGTEGGPAKVRYGIRHETRAQKLGRAAHLAILQPDLFDQRYRVTELTREGTKAWAEEEQAAMGRTLLKRADYDKAWAMRDAVFRWSEVARELLTGTVAVEQSFYWHDVRTGVLCRGRADAVSQDYHVIIDLKSAEDASMGGFRRAVRTWGYHLQAAHYLDGWSLAGGWRPTDFLLIVAEKEPPYLTASYTIDPVDLDAGRDEIARMIDLYLECDASGEWPGYEPGLQQLSLSQRTT